MSRIANVSRLVPVQMLKSEAGLGLRAGEVRGVSPETAEVMIANKSATAVNHPAGTELADGTYADGKGGATKRAPAAPDAA